MSIAAIFHRLPTGPGTDRELLRRFTDGRDEAAFAALVHRYGRMMFATCLRVLSHRADAEDAYQSAFLVFARRAGAIRSDEKLAGWLHTVAVRSATEVRRMRDRRRVAEAKGSRASGVPAGEDTPFEQAELATVLDEELAKLPDHYRLAVVLCELNGVSRKVAAKELGIAEGTLSSRLAKARKLLADRLTGRGFAGVSAGALTAALASAAVARIPVAVGALALSEGVLNVTIQSVADTVVKAMFATKLKAGALVAVLMALTGGAVWTTAAGGGPGGEPPPAGAKADTPAALVARLGSREYAEREAAQKKLKELGAAALPAVQAGLKHGSPEVVRRCQAIMPSVRAAWLARPESDVWKKFVAITGDTPLARELFLEMATEPTSGESLMAADPAKEYAARAERTTKAIQSKYDARERESQRTGIDRLGRLLLLISGRGEATLLFFLGSVPETPQTTPTIDERSRWLWTNYLSEALIAGKPSGRKFPTEIRRLIAAWLGGRKDQRDVRTGLAFARFHGFAEALPVARTMLGDDRRTMAERTPTLYLIAQLGSKDDVPRITPFLDSDAVYHRTKFTHTDGKSYPLTVEVRDVAHAAVGKLLGGDLAALGFEFCKNAEEGDNLTFRYDHYAGFTSDEKRKAAHAKVRELLKNAPVPKGNGPPRPKKLPKADPTSAELRAELVARLGSREYAEREAAQKQLRAMGTAALPAVRVGLTVPNPEVGRRCEALIGAIHKDDLDRFVAAFRKDKEYARPFDHPVWVRWAEVVGTTRGCRELFDELLLVPDAADILDAVRRKPDTAKDVYRAEMLKWYGVAQKRCNGAVKGGNLVPSHGYSTGESAFLAYLATFPGAWAEPSDDKLSGAECCPIGYLLSVRDYRPGLADLTGPNGTIRIRVPTTEADKWRALRIDSAAKWLFLKVIATRAHPQTLAYLLRWTMGLKAEDNIDPARAIFANEKLPATTRARCLNTFVDNDAVDLLPAVAKLQDDKTLLDRATDEEEIEFSVQVRDHAVATQLLLHKQDLFDYGFPKVKKGTHLFMQTGGWIQSFPDDASREAMHAKARAFLAKAGKPEKRKEYGDPVARALVEQLGDPSLAKRDAAEKALRALGEKAGRTLYSNQGRANPEIAERSYRLWAELVEARKKQPPKKTAPEPKK